MRPLYYFCSLLWSSFSIIFAHIYTLPPPIVRIKSPACALSQTYFVMSSNVSMHFELGTFAPKSVLYIQYVFVSLTGKISEIIATSGIFKASAKSSSNIAVLENV